MTVALEVAQVTDVTDASGYLSYTFVNNITQVMACGNSPQAGGEAGIVSVTVVQTGAKTCRARVWIESSSPDSWSVRPANAEQVTVTFMGISQ